MTDLRYSEVAPGGQEKYPSDTFHSTECFCFVTWISTKMSVLISVVCSWTSGDSADRHLVRSAKRPAASLLLVPAGVRSSWKSYRTLNCIFSLLKGFKLKPYRGSFSAEIAEVVIPSVSTRACLPLLLDIRKFLVPTGADGEEQRDLSPATGE